MCVYVKGSFIILFLFLFLVLLGWLLSYFTCKDGEHYLYLNVAFFEWSLFSLEWVAISELAGVFV